MSPFTIRRATLADAPVLSRVAAQTFTETFGHSYPPADLANFLAEAYSPEAQARSIADEANALWLVEHDGVAVGHAYAGPCGLPHHEVRPGDGELKRLYLVQSVQNAGQGSRLLQTALEWLERDGPRTLWIGVWSENHGAQRLYGRYGFVKVGEYEFPVGNTRDLEFILRRVPSK